jgi:uncharacterized protein YbbC (DUF1343 family)/CubicO group peptidase (beta-lactamase class C family)
MPYRKPFGALIILVIAAVLFGLAGCAHIPPPPPQVVVKPPPPPPPKAPPSLGTFEIESPRFARIGEVARREIAAGHIPGAVILVGHQDRIVYRKAFGLREVDPCPEPMKVDTIFDLASLTKVVATTMAVMKLVDEGRIRLDAPVATYWPAFGANGKECITVRELLMHTSGLPPGLSDRFRWKGYDGAMAAVIATRPIRAPGTRFCYSDINFITLGEVVHRVSGMPLDVFCTKEIFRPMGLQDTCFTPPASLKPRIAPTDYQGHGLRWGVVSDPTAHRMGGVAGHAGLFSTANDLAVFCQTLIEGGLCRGKRILSAKTVAAMEKPRRIPGSSVKYGLGWDVCSPYSKVFDTSFPTGSFGHTGYTGTSIWIDPRSETFLIILTSRLHPHGHGNVKPLRLATAAAVAAAISMGPPARRADLGRENYRDEEVGFGASDTPDRAGQVKPGIAVLAAERFAPLVGKNIGVITNHTGIDPHGRTTLSLLLKAKGVKVRAIFCPEHGFFCDLDEKIASGRDAATGLPVYSLYGKVKRPTPQMLRGLDALVYDIQDVGCRYYTYITTMAYAMEAAAAAHLDFYVLDRPDPICAAVVQGPVLDPDLKSFIGYYPLPIRYGMTAGELAQLFNRERGLGVKLHVVPMQGYRRNLWSDETGLPWVNPSPNLRSLTEALLYPGVGMVESANVSVGRGTATPFELMGAPWISGQRLADYLNRRRIAGVVFKPVVFTPSTGPYAHHRCEGIRVRVTDRAALDSPALGVELAAALYRLYPGTFRFGGTLGMVGSREVIQAIEGGVDPREISRQWQARLQHFEGVRAKYLLY